MVNQTTLRPSLSRAGLYTAEELAQFDSRNPNQRLLAILGEVFDVTKNSKMYGTLKTTLNHPYSQLTRDSLCARQQLNDQISRKARGVLLFQMRSSGTLNVVSRMNIQGLQYLKGTITWFVTTIMQTVPTLDTICGLEPCTDFKGS